ncbi:hypothetical protein [Clostridium sp. LIBA-8841]|uniref:hypothetical protein n=1 Tax=Clostridium sp. LIBA-8841 TaxID=2987530 RepID=UPI002AC66145|nr:hypothetical protein [Clostridium sp. LIBA-8841]MDZ5253938.1 hypothetical protein [Clostridium sp. LIBA-8841]
MIKEIDEKIKKYRNNKVLKEALENKISSIEEALSNKEDELKVLEKNLIKEEKDVERLKSFSFSNLMASIMNNKKEKLNKEEKEYLDAKLKYDNLKSDIKNLNNDLEEEKKKLRELQVEDNQYEALIIQKIDILKRSNLDVKDEIIKYENEISSLLNEKVLVLEVLNKAENALMIADEIKSALEGIENWGPYTIVGTGIINSIENSEKIDYIKSTMERLSYSVEMLNEELKAVRKTMSLEDKDISGTAYIFDHFFNCMLNDFSDKEDTKGSLYEIYELEGEIRRIAEKLKNEQIRVNMKIKELNEKLENIARTVS